jgi:hypothetical protein
LSKKTISFEEQGPEVDERVEALLERMTLEEKVGQRVQIHVGQLGRAEAEARIGRGQAGSVLNLYGAAQLNALQRIAVEESRLGIPLLFSNDVIFLYPFGYGLGYTTFHYSDLAVETPRLGLDGTLVAAATVTNVGLRPGEEVVQLYVRDLVGGVTRPVKELKGFRRISLAPGQSQRVRFEVPVGTLGFHGPDMRYVVEPGEFRLWIGPHAAEGPAGTFEVVD